MNYCVTLSLLLFVAPAEPPKERSLAELAREESPEQMVKAWTVAVLQGDLEAVKAAFDLSTEQGRETAEAVQMTARFMKANRALREAAQRKYGEEGVKAVEKALHSKLGGPDEQKLKQARKA